MWVRAFLEMSLKTRTRILGSAEQKLHKGVPAYLSTSEVRLNILKQKLVQGGQTFLNEGHILWVRPIWSTTVHPSGRPLELPSVRPCYLWLARLSVQSLKHLTVASLDYAPHAGARYGGTAAHDRTQ